MDIEISKKYTGLTRTHGYGMMKRFCSNIIISDRRLPQPTYVESIHCFHI